MLTALSHLASQTEQILADISYRFSATNAYYDLVCSRIAQLKEQTASKLLNDMGGMRKKLKLQEVQAASLEEVEGWLN